MINTIVIGSGIAGLYYTYKNLINKNFLILEKNNYIGGRIKTSKFYGQTIVHGAGVGRYDKDKLLKKLLKELDIPIKKIINKKNYYPPLSINFDSKEFINGVLNTLREYYQLNPNYRGSFKDIMLKLFNPNILDDFIDLNGYTDFLKEDYRETLFHYDIEDNIDITNIFYIPWKQLIDKLVSKIGRKNIYTNCEVKNIYDVNPNGYKIETMSGDYLIAKKIIIATDISFIHKIFPKNYLYKFIDSQNFSRIYVKFDKKSTEIIKKYINGYTIVSRPLQKIIPISEEKGIYMIAYNDNINSIKTKNISIEKLIKNIIGENLKDLKVLDKKIIFWKIGTHYFKPYFWDFKDWSKYMFIMQNPAKDIHIVGEPFSSNQGWVEGALESVKNVKNVKF
jgi:hypothetical protein